MERTFQSFHLLLCEYSPPTAGKEAKCRKLSELYNQVGLTLIRPVRLNAANQNNFPNASVYTYGLLLTHHLSCVYSGGKAQISYFSNYLSKVWDDVRFELLQLISKGCCLYYTVIITSLKDLS